jgi:predicted transposase/invertase (TIGR01784 family)
MLDWRSYTARRGNEQFLWRAALQRYNYSLDRTILYYLSRATDRVNREDLQTALLRQGAEGERMMNTIAQEYIRQGIEQGIEQGRLEEKRQIARQLLKLHTVVTVSELTGLSLEEVKALKGEKNGR